MRPFSYILLGLQVRDLSKVPKLGDHTPIHLSFWFKGFGFGYFGVEVSAVVAPKRCNESSIALRFEGVTSENAPHELHLSRGLEDRGPKDHV